MGGNTIQKESDEIGFCKIGGAVVTSAGDLPAKSVIHVPTIDYLSNRRASIDDIKNGVSEALDIAKNSGFKKVTFPLLGAGIVGLPPGVVARNMKEIADKYEELNSILVIHSKPEYEEVKETFKIQG